MSSPLTVTQAEIATCFGVRTRTIQRWEADGFPRASDTPTYHIPDCIAWVQRRDKSGTFEEARTRKTEIEAELKDLELSERRGDLVSRDEVGAMVRRPLEAVDASLRTARRRHSKAWARKLKTTQAVAMSLIDQVVEDVRADLKAAIGEVADAA